MANADNCSFDTINILKENFEKCKDTSSSNLFNSLSFDSNYNVSSYEDNSLCSIYKDKVYDNCIKLTGDPWYTVDFKNNECKLPEDISFPKEFKRLKDNTIEKPDNFVNLITEVCQERWYDWFTIPDYYHGNNYFIDSSNVCYDICELHKVPYPSDKTKCIEKKDLDYGLYENQFNYTPLQIVLLFGHDIESIKKKQKLNTINYYEKINESIEFELNTNNTLLKLVNKEWQNNNNIDTIDTISSNIFTDITAKKDQLINNKTTYKNIIIPNKSVLSASDFIHTPEHIEDAYNIAYAKKDMIISQNDTDEVKKRIFLKACDICFNGNSYYSNNIIFYRLNNKKENENIKKPITGLKYAKQSTEGDLCNLQTRENCENYKECKWDENTNPKCKKKESTTTEDNVSNILNKAIYKEYEPDENRVDYDYKKYTTLKFYVKLGFMIILLMFSLIILYIIYLMFQDSIKYIFAKSKESLTNSFQNTKNWFDNKQQNNSANSSESFTKSLQKVQNWLGENIQNQSAKSIKSVKNSIPDMKEIKKAVTKSIQPLKN